MAQSRKKPTSLLIATMRLWDCYSFLFDDENSFDPDTVNSKGHSLLYIAASEGHFEIVKQLVELDATIDTQHETPLQIAAKKMGAIQVNRGNLRESINLSKAYLNIIKHLIMKGAQHNQNMIAEANQTHEKFLEMCKSTELVKTSCEQLNRISQPLELPQWKYNDKHDAYLNIENSKDFPRLQKLADYLKSEGNERCRYSIHPETKIASLYFDQPDPKQLKEIPAYETREAKLHKPLSNTPPHLSLWASEELKAEQASTADLTHNRNNSASM